MTRIDRPVLIAGSAGETFGTVLRTREVGDFILRESRYSGELRMPAHYHPLPYLSYLVRGRLRERSPRTEHLYEAGSVHFHPPDDPHTSHVVEPGMNCLSIVVGGELAKRLTSDARRLPVGPADPHVARLAERCAAEFHSRDSASELALEAAALELVAGLLPTPLRVARSRAPHWLGRVRDHLHAHHLERVALTDLAALAAIHPVHLVRAFRYHVGETPGGYVRRLRIETACRALRGSATPIACLSLDVGFSSQAHFTTVFRRFTGTTPAAYRRLRTSRVGVR